MYGEGISMQDMLDSGVASSNTCNLTTRVRILFAKYKIEGVRNFDRK